MIIRLQHVKSILTLSNKKVSEQSLQILIVWRIFKAQ
jgi:hypothetical protein